MCSILDNNRRFYNWDDTFSRQTGTNGEICWILGGKGIGKTFGLRKKCVERFLKHDELFCEICRTNEEMKAVSAGYFEKLQAEGYFRDYIFKTEHNNGYIAKKPVNDDSPNWRLICYFVALTNFQREKKRTFVRPRRFIFDEAVIDRKDRHHRYLNDEVLILANLLDSITRQQPGDNYRYNLYLIGNAVDDLTCPYFEAFGINKIPKFGYTFYKNKTVLLHRVESWDASERRAKTLVGRMLEGSDESKIIFDNEFQDNSGNEIMRKTPNAQYKFAFKWAKFVFAVWVDEKRGLWFITTKVPKDASNIYTLAKADSNINYSMLKKASPLAKLLRDIYYIGGLRYDKVSTREAFFSILTFLGIN